MLTLAVANTVSNVVVTSWDFISSVFGARSLVTFVVYFLSKFVLDFESCAREHTQTLPHDYQLNFAQYYLLSVILKTKVSIY